MRNYLIDMDGVIVRGDELISGADAFVDRLHQRQIKFIIFTNNPMYTPFDLQHQLQRIGLCLSEDPIYTSAMATADFLESQLPRGSAFVLGETTTFSFARITQAIRWVAGGARFIATNPDSSSPNESGLTPGCGAIAAMIEAATGVHPYYIGKPNPLMMRTALRRLGAHSETTALIGDRMDTDIRVGLETGMETILVLTGVTSRDMVSHFPYRPTRIVESVADFERDGDPS